MQKRQSLMMYVGTKFIYIEYIELRNNDDDRENEYKNCEYFI